MRKLLFLVLWAPGLLCAQTNGVSFTQSPKWDDIKAQAKAEHKYIFLDAYASWCGPCKRMDKEVYVKDTVGNLVNPKFISVKLQFDSTKNDNELTRMRYADAKRLSDEYQINGFPTLFFFNSDGELIFRDEGYKSVADFTKLISQVVNPANARLFEELNNYKNARKVSVSLDSLAMYAKNLGQDELSKKIAKEYVNILGKNQLLDQSKILFVLDMARDRKLADSLARIYINQSLNIRSNKEILKSDTVHFLVRFNRISTSHDKLFLLCRFKPKQIDSLMDDDGLAMRIVESVITREELANKLLKDDKPVYKKPDWAEREAAIHKKYPEVQAKKLLLDFKIKYFKTIKDWTKYTNVLIQRVDTYGPYGYGEAFMDFDWNNHAWDLFQHSNDRRQLNKALAWSDSAINIASKGDNKSSLANWKDTKANLLYKLGRVKEAIALETEAIQLDPGSADFKEALKKMRAGLPTWPKINQIKN